MDQIAETRRAGQRERASKSILGRNEMEDTAPHLSLQAAFVAGRFAVSAATARLVAEHAFAKGVSR